MKRYGTAMTKNKGMTFVGLIGVVALVLTSIFFGLLATTANVIYIVLGVGAIFSILLITQPALNIWMILIIGLLFAGVVPLWTEGFATKVGWVVSIFGFVTLVSALFSALVNPASRKNTPAFVWIGLAFLIHCLFFGLVNWYSSAEYIGGVKRYFQVISLLFAFSWIGFTEAQMSKWFKLMVFVVIAQLPWALYQLIVLVPMREAVEYAYPGMVPIDVVAGTFGASLYGGGASGDMALFLVVVVGFILAQINEPGLKKTKLLYFLPFVLIPLFIGETKVVIILLPLMFLMVYRRQLIKRPVFSFFSMLAGMVITIASFAAYSVHYDSRGKDDLLTATIGYNLQDNGYGGYYLNRTTVLSFWFNNQGWGDPVGFVVGHGIGSAHSSTAGHIAVNYSGFGIDLNAISSLLWEQGLLGALLFLAIFVSAWRVAGQLSNSINDPRERAHATAIQSAIPVLAFFLIYRASYFDNLPFQIIFYLMLGYLAYLWKKNKKQETVKAE